MEDLYYWIALRLTFGIGNINYKNLLNRFGSPEKIFSAHPEELGNVEGVTARTVESILNFKHRDEIDRELELIANNELTIITFNSTAYPETLKYIYDPPPYLYVQGELKQEDMIAIAVVGSRYPSEYGKKTTEHITSALAAKGITIISGLARGIDSCAHRAALKRGGRTIAVLGCGIDVLYPPENKRLFAEIVASGAVVSEYPLGTEPSSYNFPARNRIISGLSAGVLVTEATQKSGSLITARLALEQGKDVFAVPGNIYSPKSRGTHDLIKSGAKLVENVADILDEMPMALTADDSIGEQKIQAVPLLDAETKKIFMLMDKETVHIDTLIEQSGLSSSHLSSILLNLELDGFIKQLPGKRFIRT